jgi:membrane-bound lytic murein transglycosylase A
MTGYYEPLLEGSRVRAGPFTVPIYRAPAVNVTAARRDLAATGGLRGLELLWVRDPVEAFFLEVQGSGRIHLTDGNWVRVAYAASNGQEYRSVGRWLADQGELPLGQVSQQAIRAWALAHPQRVREMLEQNPRVVFFRELPVGDPGSGPVGSLGVALTPGVSVAVDPRFLPLGAPLLLDTRAPISDAVLRRLTVAQDTGGAIRGPLRVDWFWGLGPDAGEIAGHQHAPGTVRLLVPRGIPPEALL